METYKLETCNRHFHSQVKTSYIFPVFRAENFRSYTQLIHPEYFIHSSWKYPGQQNNQNANYYIKEVQS